MPDVKKTLVFPALVLLLAVGAVSSGPAARASGEDVARRLLDKTDDLQRGNSSHGKMTMHVKTDRWDRTLTMEIWSKGRNLSLVRILSPASEAGMATLKVDKNVWNYLPKVDRTMKVPPSMMSASWMGSHFTNDDLVRDSRMADDYTFTLESEPATNAEGLYVIACIPKPEAPVVWGKVVVDIRGADEMPTDITYFDEKGGLARTMTFTDVHTVGKRSFPTHVALTVADKPGEVTEISYADMQFDLDLPESIFTLQGLKQ
jgi:outer membrane lipoprotein-sorting protein